MLSAESETPFLYSAKNVLPARAKLNLSLSIFGQRADGYHDLQSLMVTLSLADRLHVAMTRSDQLIQRISTSEQCKKRSYSATCVVSECNTGTSSSNETLALDWRVGTDQTSIPEDHNNIAWKAALAFCRAADIAPTSVIFSADIEKNIPEEAGLGGGSADAAAVLRFLYNAWQQGGADAFEKDPRLLTSALIEKAACATGADVPFCLRGGVAFCEGIGERMTPLVMRSPFPVLLAIPPSGIKTGEAYARLHQLRQKANPRHRPYKASDLNREALIKAWQKALDEGDLTAIAPLVHNDFIEVAVYQDPAMTRLFEALQGTGAPIVSLSGSGPVCFALFEEEKDGHSAQLQMQNLFPNVCFMMTTLSPEEDVLI